MNRFIRLLLALGLAVLVSASVEGKTRYKAATGMTARTASRACDGSAKSEELWFAKTIYWETSRRSKTKAEMAQIAYLVAKRVEANRPEWGGRSFCRAATQMNWDPNRRKWIPEFSWILYFLHSKPAGPDWARAQRLAHAYRGDLLAKRLRAPYPKLASAYWYRQPKAKISKENKKFFDGLRSLGYLETQIFYCDPGEAACKGAKGKARPAPTQIANAKAPPRHVVPIPRLKEDIVEAIAEVAAVTPYPSLQARAEAGPVLALSFAVAFAE
jgi:hypothetical protein